MTDKRDIHTEITNAILAQIEAGAGEFQMPWHRDAFAGGLPTNATTGKRYNGINILSLWVSAEKHGFASSEWATFKQWQARDCRVRKGEKGSPIVFYKQFDVTPDPDQPDDNGRRMVAKASWVFNASQVDDYTPADVTAAPDHGPIDRIAAADTYTANTGATVLHGGDRAYYRPAADNITMPDERRFFDTATGCRTSHYYCTLLHELAHWTGHKSRLDRNFQKRGDAITAYAFEELVAELSAAFLCAALGIANEPRKDHAQYIENWLQALRHDKRAIFHAAAQANRAVEYLDTLQTREAARHAA